MTLLRYSTMNLPTPSMEDISNILNETNDPVSYFESYLSSFFSVKQTKLKVNCFTAISLLLNFLTKNRPKTVITTAFSYRRTDAIINWANCKPIYIDNDPVTYGPDISKLEDVLKSNKVGCVLAQHSMVKIANYRLISEVCQKYDTPVIYDSVEVTSKPHEKSMVGSNGDFEVFSMHPSKVINACEGGIITSNDSDLIKKFENHLSMVSKSTAKLFQIEPYHAIFGLASMKKYDFWVDVFKQQYLEYCASLSCSSSFDIVEYDETYWNPNYKTTLMEIHDEAFRDELIDHLSRYGIPIRRVYHPYKFVNNQNFPVADELSKKLCFLPMGATVMRNGQQEIIERLLEI